MPRIYQPAAPRNLPMTISGADGVEIAISEQALLSQINIIGDPMAERAGMHGNIIEQALKDEKQVVIVVDSNAYAGVTLANGAAGTAYDVATIGAGNAGAEINREDGPLIAQVIIETGLSVMINVQGLGLEGMSNVVFEKNDVLAGMTPREKGMLYGFASLSGTLPRKRMNTDSRAVATTNCFADRAYHLNVGIANVMSGAREVPLEFDQKAKNTIAMVNTGAKIQKDLATRAGPRFEQKILANAMNSFGIGRAGITHGTYFNPGELDPVGEYIITVKPLASQIGIAPSPKRKLNAATVRFMNELKKLRRARDKARTKSALEKVETAERERAHRLSVRRGLAGQPAATVLAQIDAVETGRRRRLSTGATKSFVILGREGHAQEMAALNTHLTRTSVAVATTSEAPRQIKPCVEIQASQVVETARKDEVVRFSKMIHALVQRCRCNPSRGFVTAAYLVHKDEGGAGDRFLASFHRDADPASPAGMALAALRDDTRRLSQHQMADIVLQAYIAFRDGRPIDGFQRNRLLPLLRNVAANDDQDRKAVAA